MGACLDRIHPRIDTQLDRAIMPIDSLKHRMDFLRLRRGAQGRCGCILAQAGHPTPTRATTPDPPLRTGYTVSRRVGGAVVRNKVKRRLRAITRNAHTVWQLPPHPIHLNLIAHPGSGSTSFTHLQQAVDGAVRQALRQLRQPNTSRSRPRWRRQHKERHL